MPTAKQAVIAAAIIAMWSAGPVLAQTTSGISDPAPADASPNDRPGERASAVIRAIESEGAPTGATLQIDASDLARARAGGEMQATERGRPVQVERILLDDPVRSGPRAGAPATTRSAAAGRTGTRNADRPQIVRADGQSTDRTKTAAVVGISDAERYREQARYEAGKKRREPAATAATNDQSAHSVRSAQSKAEITWSAPERKDYRTAREGNEPTLY